MSPGPGLSQAIRLSMAGSTPAADGDVEVGGEGDESDGEALPEAPGRVRGPAGGGPEADRYRAALRLLRAARGAVLAGGAAAGGRPAA
jgi:hypothetical protein